MKNSFLTAFLTISVLNIRLLTSAQAQVGTPKWHFKDRVAVEDAVKKNKHNLHASYEIIICAARQGMIRSAVRAYERMLPPNPYDAPADISSSFALAYQLMIGGNRWDWGGIGFRV